MNKSQWMASLTVSAVLLAGHAYALDDDTMEVGDDAESIVNQIALPDMAAGTARDSAAKGLETANAARESGQAFGQAMAEERGGAAREIGEAAREAAAEISSDARESASEAASQARENAADIAAEARESAPGKRPEIPGRP